MSLKEAANELADTLDDSDTLLLIVSALLGEPVPEDWRTCCAMLTKCQCNFINKVVRSNLLHPPTPSLLS